MAAATAEPTIEDIVAFIEDPNLDFYILRAIQEQDFHNEFSLEHPVTPDTEYPVTPDAEHPVKPSAESLSAMHEERNIWDFLEGLDGSELSEQELEELNRTNLEGGMFHQGKMHEPMDYDEDFIYKLDSETNDWVLL